MATESMLKSVVIKDKKTCQKFLHALEHSKETKVEPVIMQRTVSDMTREQIQKIFGAKNG